MNYYEIPAIVVLIIKLWLFYHGGRRLFIENTSLASFLVALFLLNLSEIGLFENLSSPNESLLIMKSYYASAVFSCAALLIYSLNLNRDLKHNRSIIICISLLFITITFTSDFFIAGVESIGYSLKAIQGKYYIQLVAFLSSFLLLSLSLMLRGYLIKENETVLRWKSLISITAITPSLLTAVGIMIVMRFYENINATAILSATTTFLLYALIYAENKYDMFKLLRKIPNTEAYKYWQEDKAAYEKLYHSLLIFRLNQNVTKKIPFDDITSELEKYLINVALTDAGGVQSKAAETLGMNAPTLSKKLKKIRISDYLK